MDLIKIKNSIAIPSEVNDIVDLVTNDKKMSSIFGSYIFVSQMYPSDVDIIEEVIECCSDKDVIKKMMNIIKKILDDVKNKRGIYFSEFKAGLDKRYVIYVNDPLFIDKINSLYENKLLSNEEYTLIYDNFPIVDQDNKDIINEILRQRYTLRWTEDELKKGFKILEGGVKKSLISALSDFSIIKIDILAPIAGKYTEVTNFFVLVYHDADGNKHNVNFIEDYEGTLREVIEKLARKTFFNPYKLAKRMWTLSRFMYTKTKKQIYKKYLEILTPFLNDKIGILYQIKAESDAIKLLYERSHSIPYKTIEKQIDNFKNRISYVNLPDETAMILYDNIDMIIKNIKDSEYVQFELDKLEIKLGNIINEFSLNFLINNNLYPPPKILRT